MVGKSIQKDRYGSSIMSGTMEGQSHNAILYPRLNNPIMSGTMEGQSHNAILYPRSDNPIMSGTMEGQSHNEMNIPIPSKFFFIRHDRLISMLGSLESNAYEQ